MGNIRQGDVWFVEAAPVPGGGTVGNEIWSGRPAVIVSNDGINERSNVVQVVYLTSPNKQRRTNTINPTVHVNSRESIAVCNQVANVDKSRLKNRIGHVENHELETIQDGIAAALGLN